MDIETPLISIGLPVYNGENFLIDTLDSILSQTFKDFELIISDNASTDGTSAICQAYSAKDKRIRYFRNETNIGANQNFNRAVDLARGKYFKWAPHDDVLAPNFLSCCVGVLEQHSDAVLAYSQVILIDSYGDPLQFDAEQNRFLDKVGNSFRNLDRPRHLDTEWPDKRYHEILFGTRWCFEVFGLIRTDILKLTSVLGTYYGSDKVLLAQLSLKGKFIEISQPLLFNRRHSSQSARLSTARAREMWSNPLKARQFKSPRILCIQGYLRAIFWADLTWYEQFRCLLVLSQWLVRVENWKRFFSDLSVNRLRQISSSASRLSSTLSTGDNPPN